MSSTIIAMTLSVSVLLGALGLFALLWGIKVGQFDDRKKFLEGALLDSEEDLQEAILMDKKRKEHRERKDKESKK